MRFLEILLLITCFTGLIWLLDICVLRKKRLAKKISAQREPWWIEYSKSFFPVLLTVLILRSFVAEPFRIPSGSMHPTLLEGDFIVVNKYPYGLRLPYFGNKIWSVSDPKKGDIVVFKHVDKGESLDLIKRVVGVPGDKIAYRDNILYVNDVEVKRAFEFERIETTPLGVNYAIRQYQEFLGDGSHQILVQPTQKEFGSTYRFSEVVVPEKSYFVMGDNRDNSKDSRMWGFVKDEDIQGRAFGIWMSWDADQNTIRWDRLTMDLQ